MGQKVNKECVPEELKHVYLREVQQTGEELGRGAYGRVFKVMYNKKTYAAKEIHQILIDDVSAEESETLKDNFVKECLRCMSIRHKNIVGFVGVYSERDGIPIMVMELMHSSLRFFLEGSSRGKLLLHQKKSILQDVSNGLLFLHTHNPVIIHRDLTTNNIMLTSDMVAKIGDLGVAKVLTVDATKPYNKLTAYPGTLDFMPPEALDSKEPKYGTPVDVFSFGVVALHVFSEEWPTPEPKDPVTHLSEVARRQKFINTLTGSSVLKRLIEKCLNDNSYERPSIIEVKIELDMVVSIYLDQACTHTQYTGCGRVPCTN